jgi:hypothetical protein
MYKEHERQMGELKWWLVGILTTLLMAWWWVSSFSVELLGVYLSGHRSWSKGTPRSWLVTNAIFYLVSAIFYSSATWFQVGPALDLAREFDSLVADVGSSRALAQQEVVPKVAGDDDCRWRGALLHSVNLENLTFECKVRPCQVVLFGIVLNNRTFVVLALTFIVTKVLSYIWDPTLDSS